MDQQQQLRAELSAEFAATIETLRGEIRSLQAQIQQPSAPQARRLKSSLPDPEKFTGQSVKYDTWDAAIRAKLAIDGPAIGDSTAQFYYVYLNLASQVQAIVLPQLAIARDSGVHDFNTILDQLRRVYDNPNKIQEAEDRLLSIKQETDSIPAYIAKFERVLYEAKGQEWPDVTKISAFRKGLNNSLRSRLSQQLNLPRTYPEFIKIVQQLAGYSFSANSNATNPTHNNSYNNNGDRMDLAVGSLAIDSINPDLVALEADDEDDFDYDAAIASLASRD